MNGNAGWNYIAQFNLTTKIWENPFGTGLNSNCFAFSSCNNILYVGGHFTSVNGNSWNRIAQWNITTQTWSNPFGTGLDSDVGYSALLIIFSMWVVILQV